MQEEIVIHTSFGATNDDAFSFAFAINSINFAAAFWSFGFAITAFPASAI